MPRMKKSILKCILVVEIFPCNVFCSSIQFGFNNLDSNCIYSANENIFNLPSEYFFQQAPAKSSIDDDNSNLCKNGNEQGKLLNFNINIQTCQNNFFKLENEIKSANDSTNSIDDGNLPPNDPKVENLFKLMDDCDTETTNQNSINIINLCEEGDNKNIISTINSREKSIANNSVNTVINNYLLSLNKYDTIKEINSSLWNIKEVFDKNREEQFTLGNTQINESIEFYLNLLSEVTKWLLRQDSKKTITGWKTFNISYCGLISNDNFLSMQIVDILKEKVQDNFWDTIVPRYFDIDEFINRISKDYFIYRNSLKNNNLCMPINLNQTDPEDLWYKFFSYCLTRTMYKRHWLDFVGIFHFDKKMEIFEWIDSVQVRFSKILNIAKKICNTRNVELNFYINTPKFLREFKMTCIQKIPLIGRAYKFIELANLTIKIKNYKITTKNKDNLSIPRLSNNTPLSKFYLDFNKSSLEESFVKNYFAKLDKTSNVKQIIRDFMGICDKFNSSRKTLTGANYLAIPLLKESIAFYQSILDSTIEWLSKQQSKNVNFIWDIFSKKYFNTIENDIFLTKIVINSLKEQANKKFHDTFACEDFDINKIVSVINGEYNTFLKHSKDEYMPVKLQEVEKSKAWYNFFTYCLKRALSNDKNIIGFGYIFKFDQHLSLEKWLGAVRLRMKYTLDKARSLLKENGFDLHYNVSQQDFCKNDLNLISERTTPMWKNLCNLVNLSNIRLRAILPTNKIEDI